MIYLFLARSGPVFVRQTKYVGLTNIAQSVNAISPLMTTKDGVVLQTTWWPLWLFNMFMQEWTLSVHVNAAAYDGETSPKRLRNAAMQTPWLDVSASVDKEGTASL